MADDQPRPPENDNKDADGETPRSQETDSEVRHSDAGIDSDTAQADTDTASEAETDEQPVDETRADGAPAVESVESDEEPPAQDEEIDGTRPADEETDETPADEQTDETPARADETDESADSPADDSPNADAPDPDVPEDVRKYARFKKMDGAQYDRVNEFLRDRTYITAREWAIARLCADFRTETGVEMTKIGENLPELVPFMTDTYTPQAVNQARSSFENKVRQAGATFLYGAMSGFFTAEELDDMMYEVTEVAKFLLEVEGVDLSVEEELEAEDRISEVMREVQSASEELRHDELACPNCGHELEAAEADTVESDD
ncbi:DUF5806 family protein [Halorussus sp. AFM4]|uniref:DUF5806 family protein n=1 Tax=Halorussus sp. AFM4 TaxID=3421651 RepID=UPI003EB991CA